MLLNAAQKKGKEIAKIIKIESPFLSASLDKNLHELAAKPFWLGPAKMFLKFQMKI